MLLPLCNNSYVKFEAAQVVPRFSLVFLGSSCSWIYLFTPGEGLLLASSSSEALCWGVLAVGSLCVEEVWVLPRWSSRSH